MAGDLQLRAALASAFDLAVQFFGLVDAGGLLAWRDGPQPWAMSTGIDRRV